MKIPHENYIRFLITTGLDSEQTKEHIQDLGLFVPKDEEWRKYWDSQYEILQGSPLPKAVKKFWSNTRLPFPKGFVEYMNVVGLKEAWLYNVNSGKGEVFKLALEAVSDPDVAMAVKCLLAIRTEVDEISALVNGKYGMPFPKESVELFQKYFFNTKVLLRSDWRKILELVDEEERKLLYLAISGQREPLRAELSLPNRISVSENYQKLHIFSMQKFETYRQSSDAKADANALKWASMAMTSGDKYEKLKTSDASDFGRDLQMEFEHIQTDFPLISGNDLDQMQEAKKEGTKKDQAEPIPMEQQVMDDEFEESGH